MATKETQTAAAIAAGAPATLLTVKTTPAVVAVAPSTGNSTESSTRAAAVTSSKNSTSVAAATTTASVSQITSVSVLDTFVTSASINRTVYPTISAAEEQFFVQNKTTAASGAIHTVWVAIAEPVTCYKVPNVGWVYYDAQVGKAPIPCEEPPAGTESKTTTKPPAHHTTSATASSTHTAAPAEGKSKGANTGVIAGIVIAVVVIAAIGVGIWWWLRRKKSYSSRTSSGSKAYGAAIPAAAPVKRMEEQKENYHAQATPYRPQIPAPAAAAPIAAVGTAAMRPDRRSNGAAGAEVNYPLDQPKDDDAILAVFNDVDDRLGRHIVNYYIPDYEISEEEATRQYQSLPQEEQALLNDRQVLSGGHAIYMLRDPKLRRHALLAIASYYLYEALEDGSFIPDSFAIELRRIDASRGTPAEKADRRIHAYHRFAREKDNTAHPRHVSAVTTRLNSVLRGFSTLNPNDRNHHSAEEKRFRNLSDIVNRYSDLGIIVGKQEDQYKSQMRFQDCDDADVGDSNGKRRYPQRVRYAGCDFDGRTMADVYHDPNSSSHPKVRAVVSPGIVKYSLRSGQRAIVRKAKVVLLE